MTKHQIVAITTLVILIFLVWVLPVLGHRGSGRVNPTPSTKASAYVYNLKI